MDEWLDLPVSFYREANIRMQTDAIKYAIDKGVESIEFGGEDFEKKRLSSACRL